MSLPCVEGELLSLLLVSVLWGCTNPLLKRGTEGIENVTETSRVSQLLAELKFLFLNLKVNPGTPPCLPVCMLFSLLVVLIAPSSSVPGPIPPEPEWLFGLLLHTVHHRWDTHSKINPITVWRQLLSRRMGSVHTQENEISQLIF